MTDSKRAADDVLERNVEQLMAQAHEPPRMNPDARARVLGALVARARDRRADAGDGESRWVSLGRRPAWAAGAVLAAGVAAATIAAVIGGGTGIDPSVHQPSAVERITLADGSELIVNQGARAVVTGDRRLRVDRGEVMLDVAKAERPFVVDTPHGTIEVLGTRFLVDAEEVETRAAVVRGRVKVASGGGSAVLRAGDEGVMRPGKTPIRRRAPRLSHLASWTKLARRQAEKPEDGPARRGTLLARNPNWQEVEYPLPMRQLTVDVHVENQIARVALDQTFFNAKPQQLEGVYYLALPADASIYRQAMYVNGKRMESAVVDRGRAREIYEEIVYQRRDPALMEWMAGNLYKVRIFPLPGRTEKRIAFEYTQPLTRLYDDYRIEVPLPAIDQPVDDVTYRVRLADCARCEVASTSHELERTVDGDDLMLSLSRTNHEIGDDLVVTVRDPSLVTRVARATEGDDRYLMVRAQPEIAAPTDEPPPRARRSWVILHDTSASRSALERKAQGFVIDQLLRQLDEEDEVQLLAFDAAIRAYAEQPVQVGSIDRREVAQFLARESADGVGYTDLAAALRRAAELVGAGGAEPYILYLGDGIVTAGERQLEALRRAVEGKATFVGVAVGERMDMNVLRELADVTGGMTAVMNPGDDLAWRSFDLVAALETPRVVDLSAALVDDSGNAIDGAVLYPSARQLADGEELTLVGRIGSARPAAVRLTGRRGGEPWSREIPLPNGAGDDAGYLPRIWAERRIDHLLRSEADDARAEIVRLGTEQFLVTPHTSLLVLENEAMYRQYGVKQVRDQRWAMYQLPDEIEVVHEPIGTSAGSPVNGVPTDAVLLRSPTQIFYSYDGYDRGGLAFAEGEISNIRVTGSFDGLTTGTGPGFGAGGSGSAPLGGTISLSSPQPDSTVAATAAVRELPVSGIETASAFDGDMAGATSQVIITTEELSRGGENNEAFALRNRRAGRDANRSSSAYKRLARQDRARGQGAVGGKGGNIGWVGGRGNTRGGLDGRYYYGNASPQPIALHYATDHRLDDLTEHVPGLFADDLDVELRDLLTGPQEPGSITGDARALVDTARARIAGRRFVSADGAEIEIDDRGRLRASRTLSSGLGEEILFDGERVYHLYPQLGLATRRWARTAAAAVYARWLPLAIADADGLARWYDVTRPEPGVLRLVRAGGVAADGAVELAFDDDRRLREIAVVRGGDRTVILSVSWSDSGVTLTQGDVSERLELAEAEPVETIDEADWAVVEMPLRRPVYWQEQLEGATGAERRRVERQLLASWAAVKNPQQLRDIADEMAEAAPLSRGELTLASGAARWLSGKPQLRRWTRGVGSSDPVAAYLTASYELTRSPRGDAFGKVRRNHGGFIGAMADYRDTLAEVRDYHRSEASARKAARRYLKEGRPAPLIYIVAHAYAQRHGWRAYEPAVELWDRAASVMDDPAWQQVARIEAARWLYNRQQYDAAADRFDRLLRTMPADRPMPVLDRIAQWAFTNSGRGQAGWKLFWGRWRDQALARGDAGSLLALAQSAVAVGMQRDLDRISTRLIDLGAADPAIAAEVAGVLQMAGRTAGALSVIEPHLTGTDADPGLLALASAIAEQQGRIEEAVGYFQRALDGYGDRPITLATARQEFARMLGLLGRLAQTSAAAERAGYVDRALEYAARWRRADPDNDQIDTTVARLLYGVGRADEAWRYLTGAIERHPGEGTAYQSVATVLEEEGQVARAEELWRRAAELEPENPTWLLRRANALFALGDREQAGKLVDRIADGDWHERFQNIKWQADRLRKQMR